MCRRTLALEALRALEVAARHGSLTKAADEQSVTPAAVHHQTKALEERLGVSLLVRSGNGIALTRAASAALPTMETAFDLLSLARDDACSGRHQSRMFSNRIGRDSVAAKSGRG